MTSRLARIAQGFWWHSHAGVRTSGPEIERLTHALEAAADQHASDQAALQAMTEELDTLFRFAPIGLALAREPACERIVANAALTQLLGLPAEANLAALLGRDGEGGFAVSSDGRRVFPAELPMQRAARSGEPLHGVALSITCPNGRIVHVLAHATPLRAADGGVRGAIGAFIEVTSSAVSVHGKAPDTAASATRARDAFLTKFNHDLRNPLGAIASATEVLNRIGGQQPDEVRAREVIRRQIQHLTRMMEDLLDATRVVNGNVALSRTPIDLAAAVERAAAALRAAGRFDHHHVEFSLAPAWINGDSMRIEQIVSHLLANALKYTPPDGSISVTVAPESEWALLAVADSGVGIAPERFARIFELFGQGDDGSGRRQAGLGVGLALVRRLAELHGGTVVVSSAGKDQGSRFEVRLPRITPPANG